MSGFEQSEVDFVREMLRVAESNGVYCVCLTYRRTRNDQPVSVSWPGGDLDRTKFEISSRIRETPDVVPGKGTES